MNYKDQRDALVKELTVLSARNMYAFTHGMTDLERSTTSSIQVKKDLLNALDNEASRLVKYETLGLMSYNAMVINGIAIQFQAFISEDGKDVSFMSVKSGRTLFSDEVKRFPMPILKNLEVTEYGQSYTTEDLTEDKFFETYEKYINKK